MSSGTDGAREVLRQAIAEQWSYRDLLDLAIKQHESLRAEHMRLVYQVPGHHRSVENRLYGREKDTCPECAVLLQWEQMWEEKK